MYASNSLRMSFVSLITLSWFADHCIPHLVDVRLQFVAHVVRLPYHSILVRHLGLGLEARVELLPRHPRDLALDLEGRLLVLALLLRRLRLLGLLLGLLFFLL